MSVSSLQGAFPIETLPQGGESAVLQIHDNDIISFVKTKIDRIRTDRTQKQNIWDECWALYRGRADFRDKEEWQSKIVLPKSWNSVKNATNAVMRLLRASDLPYQISAVNPDDNLSDMRGGQITDLLRLQHEKAGMYTEFAIGLESSFIQDIGVWKVWWGLKPRTKLEVVQGIDPATGQPIKQLVRKEILEGQLFVKAVDPYNFYWLPGSKFNKWVGTFEEFELPLHELYSMVAAGAFGPEAQSNVEKVVASSIDASRKRADLRFDERFNRGVAQDIVKGVEYYGPLYDERGRVSEPNAHVIVINDSFVLSKQQNQLWIKEPPYVAFSPLLLPFRTEGVGLITKGIEVDKAMDRLINLSMDTLLFRHLPTFEAAIDVYENPEELETGLVPGKILKRDRGFEGLEGIRPVPMQDISPGLPAIASMLDRAGQEAHLISEIQQGIPRFRGQQTLGEIEIKDQNQQDFLSALAKDIDEFALKPLVELSMDIMLQFGDTMNDPRVARILGIGAEVLRGISQIELMEMVQGDYIVKVSGITDQIKKTEQLQNLIQFMNIIGQNPDSWMPFIKQDQLLQRILETFRPGIRDIENLLNDPQTVAAQRKALEQSKLTPEIIRLMPEIINMAAQMNTKEELDQTAAQVAPAVEEQLRLEQQQAQQAAQFQQRLEELQQQAAEAALVREIEGVEKVQRREVKVSSTSQRFNNQ